MLRECGGERGEIREVEEGRETNLHGDDDHPDGGDEVREPVHRVHHDGR
jgi:hypothetical protein